MDASSKPRKATKNTLCVWSLLGALGLLDAVWMAARGFSADVLRFAELFAAAGGMLGLSAFYTYIRRDARIATLTHLGAVMLVFSAAGAVFSYLLVTLNLPLVDDTLASADKALGFDWPAAYDWVGRRRILRIPLILGYASLIPQLLMLLLVLNFRRMLVRSWELMWLFIAAALACILISAAAPAAGAYAYYHLGMEDPYVAAYAGLRAGTLKIFGDMQGVVQFPSLHVALAVIFAYCARGIRWFFPLMVLLNILLVAGTPAMGGHHLADVLAGALLAAGCILGMRRVFRHLTPEDFALALRPVPLEIEKGEGGQQQ